MLVPEFFLTTKNIVSTAPPGPDLWLRREGRAPVRFGFAEFLPIGLVSFVIIEAVAIAYSLIGLLAG